MTYSYVHRAINSEAFPNAPDLYDKEQMTGRGRGRYCYRAESRAEAQMYLRAEIRRVLGNVPILYASSFVWSFFPSFSYDLTRSFICLSSSFWAVMISWAMVFSSSLFPW